LYTYGDTVSQNTARQAIDDGFYIDSVGPETVTLNTSTLNLEDGFYLYGSGLTISSNSASGNGNYGFYFDDVDPSTVTANTATGNGYAGFAFFSSDDNTITANTATGNGVACVSPCTPVTHYAGFYFEDSNYNTVGSQAGNDNTASGNTGDGYKFHDSSNNAVVDNEATGNVQHGFEFKDGSKLNTIGPDNDGSKNGYSGFDLNTGSDQNILTGNTADLNGHSGFHVDTSQGNILTSNDADTNTENGYQLNNAGGMTLIGNLATENLEDGFYSTFTSLSLTYGANTFEANVATAQNGGAGDCFPVPTVNNCAGFEIDNSELTALTPNTAGVGNSATDNIGPGFFFYGDIGVQVSHSTATANGADGFDFVGTVAFTVTNNIANNNGQLNTESYTNPKSGCSNGLKTCGNGYDFIDCVTPQFIYFTANTATGNLGNGTFLQRGSTYIQLTNDKATSNKQNGFAVGLSSDKSDIDNTLTANGASGNLLYGYADYTIGPSQPPYYGTGNSYVGNTASGNVKGVASPGPSGGV